MQRHQDTCPRIDLAEQGSLPRRWCRFYSDRSDDFHTFKTPILEHIAVLTFRLINQWCQTAMTFHERLHKEEHASFNGNQ